MRHSYTSYTNIAALFKKIIVSQKLLLLMVARGRASCWGTRPFGLFVYPPVYGRQTYNILLKYVEVLLNTEIQ